MRFISKHFPKSSKYIFIIILTLLIPIIIWKVLIANNQKVSKEYQLLATFSWDEIVFYQKTKPQFWKDYVAISTAIGKIDTNNSGKILTGLASQIENNVKFKELDWSGVEKIYMKIAMGNRKLLDKYSIYTPGKYLYPLRQPCYYIDTFGADREGGLRSHQGTDLFDKKGTPIISVYSGIVEKLGWNRLGGERVGIRGDDGNYYYYAHLDSINQELYINKIINAGDLVGTMGNTGDAITTSDHLHFGIQLPNGEWLNPYIFLKVWEFSSMT